MNDIISNLSLGFSVAISVENLFFCFVGVFTGTLIGVIPGVGALSAVSILLPMTFYLDPTTALIMLAGIYYGAEYGGSIASILLNLPGTASSAVTCLDGYPMTQQGKAGLALFATAIASFLGGTVGIILLTALAPTLARLALAFGPTEYTAIMVLGLVAAGSMTKSSPIKGIAMILLGLLIGTVGTDVNTGVTRYTFGSLELMGGVGLIPLSMGLFGLSEIVIAASSCQPINKIAVRIRDMFPSRREFLQSIKPAFRGTAIGSFFGTLPGTGQTIAAFVSYAVEKRSSAHPQKFGTGVVEGVVAPEAANSSSALTAFIPTLTLGVPGSATMALMLGALMIHGITPGIGLVDNRPEVFWGLVASFWVGNLLLLVLNIPLISIWVRLLQVPPKYLYPIVTVLICTSVFLLNNSVFDIATLLVFGLIGWLLRILSFEPAPILIGFVLGPLLEENLGRALLISGGDLSTFWTSPISVVSLVVSVLLLAIPILRSFRRTR